MEREKLPDLNEPVCLVCGIRARGADYALKPDE